MSTNAMVARKTDDGYECIHVNWDGHLDSVGKALRDVFNADEKVAELIALGDCSTIASATSLWDVEAYHRDKGEDWVDVKPETFATLAEAMQYYSNPYNYVWEDGKWTAYRYGDKIEW